LPPSYGDCLKICEPQPPGTLRACNEIALPLLLRQDEKVVWMGETKHVYRINVRKPLGKHLLSDMKAEDVTWMKQPANGETTLVRRKERWEHSTKMGLRETDC
jgi:hypothetical protein